MTKGKILKIALAVFFVALVTAMIVFYNKYLKGAGPALLPSVPYEALPTPVPVVTSTAPTPVVKSEAQRLGLQLPAGFSINIFAKGLGKPRVLQVGLDNNVWVSIPPSGKIVSLPDVNNDGVADKVVVVVSGLNYPHGFVTRCIAGVECELYVAETDKITFFNINKNTLALSNKRKIVDLPGGGNHTTRSIIFLPSPDGSVSNKLLVSIGSTCNVCHEPDPRRATVQVLDLATGQMSLYDSGLRNSVFMAVRPGTNQVWATEMGRDMLGDNTPPDEINILKENANYGWPICYGKNIHDDAFDKNTYIRNPCMEPFETSSQVDLPAHSAPLGLVFVPAAGWPKIYQNNLLVAFHGSWNRSVPTGYKIVMIKLDQGGNYVGAEDFITGWLTPKGAKGRPVDLLMKSPGVMYVSDDKGGYIYKVTAP